MKKLLLLLILFISTNAFSQEIKKEERDNLSNQIFDSLTESERKKAFIEIIGLDDFAIDKSTQQHPDPNDFEAQFNQQRNLESYWRMRWYYKQKWWDKVKKNEDVAFSVRSKIVFYGLKKDWDTTIYSKKGKILSPPKF